MQLNFKEKNTYDNAGATVQVTALKNAELNDVTDGKT